MCYIRVGGRIAPPYLDQTDRRTVAVILLTEQRILERFRDRFARRQRSRQRRIA